MVKSPNLLALKLKGYDKKTDSLHYGFKPQYQDNRIFRVKREEDRRLFNGVARNSLFGMHKNKNRTKKTDAFFIEAME